MGNLRGIQEKLRIVMSSPKPIIDQIREQISSAGLLVPDNIVIDGKIHRFNTRERDRKRTGWYVFFPGNICAGAFGCWRDDLTVSWHQEIGRELTSAELVTIEEQRKKAQALREEKREKAANEAAMTWECSHPAPPDHPYLIKKGLSAPQRSVNGALILPYFSSDAKIKSYELIYPDGTKRAQKGGSRRGLYGIQGEPAAGTRAFITEGFSDAATIHQETGVCAAFSGGADNLLEATRALKKRWPDVNWCIVSDNDPHGKGQKAAQQAMQELDVDCVTCPTPGQDVNDMFLAGVDVGAWLMPPVQSRHLKLSEARKRLKPPSYLVQDWIAKGSYNVLHGASGSAKTLVVVDMAMHIATGKTNWYGRKVKQAKVSYLCGEGFESAVERMAIWEQHYQADAGDNMLILPEGDFLDEPARLNSLLAEYEAQAFKPDFVIVDTLNCFYAGDENSSQHQAMFNRNMRTLINKTGAAVLVITHTGLSQEAGRRMRGSGAIKNNVDYEFHVCRVSEGVSELSRLKMRRAVEDTSPLYFQMNRENFHNQYDEYGRPWFSEFVTEANKPKKQPKEDTPLQLIQAAWWHCGAHWKDDKPVLDRDQLKQFLIDQRGLAPSTAKDYCQPSRKNRMLGQLIEGNFVACLGKQVTIIEPALIFKLKQKTHT